MRLDVTAIGNLQRKEPMSREEGIRPFTISYHTDVGKPTTNALGKHGPQSDPDHAIQVNVNGRRSAAEVGKPATQGLVQPGDLHLQAVAVFPRRAGP
jgi:hypothetical protein